MQTPVDFAAVYDEHPEYVARRRAGSFEEAQIDIEVRLFKLPNLLALLAGTREISSVLEIGCATGELIRTLRRATFAAATLVRPFGRRLLASKLFVVARRPAEDGAIGPAC